MKTILIVKDALLPWSKGGGEDRYFLFRSLNSEDNVSVKFASMKWWEEESLEDHFAISRLIPLYGKNGKRSIFQAIYFAFSTLKIIRLRPDLIEADQAPILQLFPLWLVSRILKVPFTCTVHEYWGKDYWLKNYGAIGHIGWRLENFVLRLPDVIITPSSLTSGRIEAAIKSISSIATIPNQVIVPQVESISTEIEAVDVLYAGRLIEHKRVDLVIDAFQLLLKDFPKLRLGIVGNGPDFETLLERASKSLPSSSFTFFDVLEEKSDVLGLMKNSRIFFSPSEREGFGIAVLEALLLETYVLISNSEDNASKDFITEHSNLFICKNHTPAGYAEIAKKILSLNPYRRAISLTKQEKSLTESYLKIWRELL
jgi:glycosyltransferase involved in cell wall biosynthesis